MLVSLLIVTIVLGFITFVFAIEKHSIVYSLTSLMIWMLVMANSLYIEVPGASSSYADHGLSAFALLFIFLNLIWTIVKVFDIHLFHERRFKF